MATADGPGVRDAYTCPVCGIHGDADGTLAVVSLDEDLDGSARLLQPRPLDARCGNCGTVHLTYAGFVFVSPERGVVIACADESERAAFDELAASDSMSSVEVIADVDDACRAVRRHLIALANDVLVPFQIARVEDDETTWVSQVAVGIRREELNAALLLTPLMVTPQLSETGMEPAAVERHIAAMIRDLVAYRAIAAVVDALDSATDGAEALDRALLPEALSSDAVTLLATQVLRADAIDSGMVASAVTLAWWSDRTRSALPDDVAAQWRAIALSWALVGEGNWPEPVPIALLRATIPPAAVLTWGASTGAQAVAVVSRAVELELVPPELVLSMRLHPSARGAMVDQARTAPVGELHGLLHALGANGWLDDVAAVYSERLPDLERTDDGVATTRQLVEILWRGTRAREALELADEFLARSGGWEWMDPTRGVTLLNELGNVARQLRAHETARAHYAAAARLIPGSAERASQEPVLVRNIAIIERELRRPAVARDLLLDLLSRDLPDRVRAETLESLSMCLLLLGEPAGAMTATREAVELTEPATGGRPADHAQMLMQAAQAAQHSGDADAARGFAERAVTVAEELEDHRLLASAATLWAVATIDADGAEAEALLNTALRRIDEAEAALGGSDLLLQSLAMMRVRLLSETDDVDGMLAAISDGRLHDWSVHAMAASALLDAGRRAEAEAHVEAAWDVLLETLARDDLDSRDAGVLRNARSLQAVTTWVALHPGHGDAERRLADVIRAVELSASVVGGLTAWPLDRRPEAIALLAEPSALLAMAGTDAVVVLAAWDGTEVEVLAARAGSLISLGRWERGELDALRAEISATTLRSAADGDPLAASPLWQAWSQDVGRALEPVVADAATVLLLQVEPLHGLPMHMVPVHAEPLCVSAPCSYASSLLQVAGLRRREPGSPLPGRSAVVAVPRAGDKPAIKALFKAAGALWSAALGTDHADPIELTGAAADRAAVLALMESAELLLLACHGQSQPGYGRHGLLLAHDGQLPPVLMGSASSASGRRFLLPWDELTGSTPAVVMSAACSSGSSTFAAGGERLSIDRALVEGGTNLFFGPMWDVSVRYGLEMAAGLVRYRLAGAATWADAWQELARDASTTMPAAAWQSFVLTGDWRYGSDDQ
ncbi:MAG: hypothetical protein AAGC49_15495 [Brevundimonas sp.]